MKIGRENQIKHRIDMPQIYLLYGEYDDKSGVKIPRAYLNKTNADKDLELLKECNPCGSMNWEIIEVPLGDGKIPDNPIMR